MMRVTVIVLLAAIFLLGPLPALFGWILVFGRHHESTMAEFHAEGTYYEPYDAEMKAAEARLLGDPSLRKAETVSEDGIHLCAEYIPGKGERAVIFVHGFTASPTKNFGVVAESYRAAGYDILLTHLRCQGPSGGRHNALGAAEWRDVLAWVKWCGENLTCRDIVLHGASMGATAVGLAAGHLKNSPVKALVIDSGFISPWYQLRQQGRQCHVPTILTLPLLNAMVRGATGADLRSSLPDTLRGTDIPVIFVHGTEDSTVPLSQGRTNYDSCGSEKQFLEVEGAEHTLALIAGGEKARQQVLEFIDRQITDDGNRKN